MATRAVYTFTRPHFACCHIYNHWDGYPEGAVELLKGVRTPEDFIRKNQRAVLTVGPADHGDLEYHYHISQRGSELYVTATRFNFDGSQEQLCYQMLMVDFEAKFGLPEDPRVKERKLQSLMIQ